MGTRQDEEETWQSGDAAHWRGLGLTDPIKSVEVCCESSYWVPSALPHTHLRTYTAGEMYNYILSRKELFAELHAEFGVLDSHSEPLRT